MNTWMEVAIDARRAANELVTARPRSCLSRAYYAVYSKVTHDLVASGVPMPLAREGPAHPGHLPSGEAADKGIRQLVVMRLTALELKKRQALSELIGDLYTLRLYADYKPSYAIDDRDAREAIAMMETVFRAF